VLFSQPTDLHGRNQVSLVNPFATGVRGLGEDIHRPPNTFSAERCHADSATSQISASGIEDNVESAASLATQLEHDLK